MQNGIRTYKQVVNSSGTTTYKYNLMGSNITYEKRIGANACELYYAYDNNGKLYRFYYDGASNDGFYFYKRNIQGDIIGILNSSGTEVVTYTYDTWGKQISTTGTLASTVGADNPFRYRGYYYDTETGLYYLNQRYYNPEWGRFISADSYLGQTGDLLSHNLYAYCKNNPVNMWDPTGMLGFGDFRVMEAAITAVSGIVYLRTDLDTRAEYVGQAKSYERYLARQAEHARANNKKYDFSELRKNVPLNELRQAEQEEIDRRGDPKIEPIQMQH